MPHFTDPNWGTSGEGSSLATLADTKLGCAQSPGCTEAYTTTGSEADWNEYLLYFSGAQFYYW
jgi:hypothetical protein